MNLSGAEKLSVYLGQLLIDEAGLTDRRGEEALQNIWEVKIATYEAEIEFLNYLSILNNQNIDKNKQEQCYFACGEHRSCLFLSMFVTLSS